MLYNPSPRPFRRRKFRFDARPRFQAVGKGCSRRMAKAGLSRWDGLFYGGGRKMRMLENSFHSRLSRVPDRRVHSRRTGDVVSHRRCVTHHACDCRMARIVILEATLRRVVDEFGGAKIVVNGVGQTTVGKWLRLDEVLQDHAQQI